MRSSNRARAAALLCCAVIMVFLSGGCTFRSEFAESSAADYPLLLAAADRGESGFRMAFFGAESESFAAAQCEQSFLSAARSYRSSGVVERYMSFCAGGDPETQLAQIHRALDSGYNIIIVDPAAESGYEEVIRRANKSGAVYLNHSALYPQEGAYNFRFNQTANDLAIIEKLCSRFSGGGTFLLLETGGSSARQSMDIYRGILNGYPQIETVTISAEDVGDLRELLKPYFSESGVWQFDAVLCSELSEAIVREFEAVARTDFQSDMLLANTDQTAYLNGTADVPLPSVMAVGNSTALLAELSARPGQQYLFTYSQYDLGGMMTEIAVKIAQGRRLVEPFSDGDIEIDRVLLISAENIDQYGMLLNSGQEYLLLSVLFDIVPELFAASSPDNTDSSSVPEETSSYSILY